MSTAVRGKMGYKELEKRIFEIIGELEVQKLTSVELSFRNGWKFKLMHPKRNAVLMKGGNPYP